MYIRYKFRKYEDQQRRREISRRFLDHETTDHVSPKKSKWVPVMLINLRNIMNNDNVREVELFLSGTHKFKDVAVLGPMVDILVEELPAFDFVKEEGDEAIDLYSISLQEEFTEEKVNLLVDKLELHGAACILWHLMEIRCFLIKVFFV
jgi:hypothetical protein